MRSFFFFSLFCFLFNQSGFSTEPDTGNLIKDLEAVLNKFSDLQMLELANRAKENSAEIEKIDLRLKKLEVQISALRKALAQSIVQSEKSERNVKLNREFQKLDLIELEKRKTIDDLIADTINRGAILYNPPKRRYAECYSLYESTLETILPELSEDLRNIVEQALKKGQTERPDDGAFTLRYVLDKVRLAQDPESAVSVSENAADVEILGTLLNVLAYGKQLSKMPVTHGKRQFLYRNALIAFRPHLPIEVQSGIANALEKSLKQSYSAGAGTLELQLKAVKLSLLK